MKNIIALLFIIMAITNTGFGKPSEVQRSPLKVVEALFDEMAAAEPAKIASLFAADAQLQAVIYQADGSVRRQTFTAETFSSMFRDKTRKIKEIMYDPKVEIDGDWAMVWGRYVFYIDDKISHCGMNQLNLVKIGGEWKLANGVTTMQPNGCNEKEKQIKP